MKAITNYKDVYGVIIFWAVFLFSVNAQTSWTDLQQFGNTSYNQGDCIKIDGSGNRYISGTFTGTVDFGGTSLSSAGSLDIFLIKQNANGALVWARRMGGGSYDQVSKIALDANGNIFLVGAYRSTVNFSGSSITLSAQGNTDGFLAKYDNNGNLLWAKGMNGYSDEATRNVVAGNNGDVYACGIFKSTINFGGVSLSSSGNYDVFIVKYDSSGNVLWANRAGGGGDDRFRGISLDSQGNVYSSGIAGGSNTISFSNSTTTLSSSGNDGLLTKYSSSGNLHWAKLLGGSGSDYIGAVSADAANHVFVVCNFSGTITLGGTTFSSNGSRDVFLTKLDNAGNFIWATSGGGSAGDFCSSSDINSNGNISIGVYFRNTATFSGTSFTSLGGVDFAVLEYDSNGNFLSGASAGGNAEDYISSISYENNTTIFVLGRFKNDLTAGSQTINSFGNYDIYLAELNVVPNLCTNNIVYVNQSATSGNNNGASWANAFTDFQDALDLAKSCPNVTHIWVAQGTYIPTQDKNGGGSGPNDRNNTFYIDFDIEIYGGFPNTGNPMMLDRNSENHITILSGNIGVIGDDADNVYSVVHTTDLTSAFVMDGFQISQGFALETTGDEYFNPKRNGGAWYNDGINANSFPTINNCIFSNNSGRHGGALYNANIGGAGLTGIKIMNCKFSTNYGHSGAAIHNYWCSPEITNCSFDYNTGHLGTVYNEGGLAGTGNEANPLIRNCKFFKNGQYRGGAILNNGNTGVCSPTILNCSFSNNTVSTAGAGGAIYNLSSTGVCNPHITNCSFYGNYEGAIHNSNYNNPAGTTNPIVTNCVFGNGISMTNQFPQIYTPQFNYCLLQESTCPTGAVCDANTILGQDPLFVDPDNHDLRTIECSPALDSGNDNAPGLTNISLDLEGNNRFFDAIPNSSFDVDMGAYEYQGDFVLCCPPTNIIFVDSSATGINNGASWANAFTDFQDALDLAKSCTNVSHIWVAQGTYLPTQDKYGGGSGPNDRNNTFYIDFDIEIYGGFPNTGNPMMLDRNTAIFITTLSGDLGTVGDHSDNAYSVIHTKNVSSAFVMGGFFIKNGNANGSGSETTPNKSGGGWFNEGSGLGNRSNPTIMHCNFLDNYGSHGGAMGNYGGQSGESSPKLTNCDFINNSASIYGGAMFNDSRHSGKSNPTMTDCDFINNNASIGAGAIFNFAYGGEGSPILINCNFINNRAYNCGAIFNNARFANGVSNPHLTDCSFTNNFATNRGGAIYNGAGHSLNSGTVNPTFINCDFTNNSATNGGAIFSDGRASGESNSIFTNCNFSDNSANDTGGVMFNDGYLGDCSPKINNCKFSGNQAGNNGGVLYSVGNSGKSAPEVINSIFYNNSATNTGGVLGYDDGDIARPSFSNCTFYNNSATTGGVIGIRYWDNANIPPLLKNCIAWNNSSTFGTAVAGGTVELQYSLIQETNCPVGATCDANTIFNIDPLFVDVVNNDFHLLPCSPAIDIGTSSNAPIIDLDGNSRPVNVEIDLGAYESQVPVVTIMLSSSKMDVSCYGENDGSIDVAISGGTSAYTFLWNDGNTDEDRMNLSPGNYELTATDTIGCFVNASWTISEPTELTISNTLTHPTCSTAADGAIDITGSGGTMPYNFLWNDGITSQNRSGLLEGNYAVTLTDGNTCIKTLSMTLIANDTEFPEIACAPDITVNTDPFSCSATNVTLGNPIASDNCSAGNPSNNAPFSYPIGTTIVIWTVTDGAGNTTTCPQEVTINPIYYTWYEDADGDGYGNASQSMISCEEPPTYVLDNMDCDDTNSSINPGALEITCNGIDEDCSGSDDESTGTTWYEDADGDNYGNAAVSIWSCKQPENYVSNDMDCNDTDPNINPAMIELCGNGIDDNCDGQIDETCPIYCSSYGESTQHGWIKQVKFAGINNISADNGGYADFTDLFANVQTANSYSIELEPGYSQAEHWQYWCVWIDFNQDFDWDDDGELSYFENKSGTVNGIISIPDSALAGTTQMRVTMRYNDWPEPCIVFSDGEVEDYSVQLRTSQNVFVTPSKKSQQIVSEPLVYPNPARNVVNISLEEIGEKPARVLIYNQLAQLVYEKSMTDVLLEIDISHKQFTNGIYLVQIEQNGLINSTRLIVTK